VAVWLSILIDADLVELGEGWVYACHVGIRRDNVGLLGVGLDVGPAELAFEPDGDWFAGAQIAYLCEGGADQEVVSLAEVGDRNRIATLRLPADDVEGDQPTADDPAEAWGSQQGADDEIHEALPWHRLCPRLRVRAGACRARVTGHRCSS
jgi:hypothetical protein